MLRSYAIFKASRDVSRSSLQEFLVIILIRCKFVHFNQNYCEIVTNFAEIVFALKMREENFWYKNRVIARSAL